MCEACWIDAGSPMIRNEQTEAAADLIRKLYALEPVGGNCHIVTDDWNLEDSGIDYCLTCCDDPDQRSATYHAIASSIEREVLTTLRAMTLDERYSALAMFDGFTD